MSDNKMVPSLSLELRGRSCQFSSTGNKTLTRCVYVLVQWVLGDGDTISQHEILLSYKRSFTEWWEKDYYKHIYGCAIQLPFGNDDLRVPIQ